MAENFALGISFKGNASHFLGETAKAARGVQSFASTAIGAASRAGKAFVAIGSSTSAMLGGLATVSGLMYAGKQVMDFDARLARLAINAGLTRTQMYQLKGELYATAHATKQSEQALLSSVEETIKRTGDYDFAIKSMNSLGIVASATGASMESLGGGASDLMQKFGISANEILPVFDILSAQGKAGAFELRDMAEYFPRLLSSAAALGVHGKEGIRTFGAFLQIARQGAGSSDMAATAVERVFSDIVQNWKVIHKETGGFSVWDIEKSKKEGRHVAKDFDVILKEIVRRTGGDITKLQKIFNEYSIRAINPLALSYRKHGDFREMDELTAKGGDGAAVMKDLAFWTEETASKMDELQTTVRQFANENFKTPIEGLNKLLTLLNAHPVAAKAALWGGVALAGTVAAGSVAAAIKRIYDMSRIGAGGNLPGGIAGELNKALAIQKVFVTNWPKSMGGSGVNAPLPQGSQTPSMPGEIPKPSWWRKSWNLPGKAGTMALAPAGFAVPVIGAAALLAASVLNSKRAETEQYAASVHAESVNNTNAVHQAVLLATINKQQGSHFKTVQEAMAQLHKNNAASPQNTSSKESGGIFDDGNGPQRPAEPVKNDIAIAIYQYPDGSNRVITHGANTTTRIHNPGKF